jgi:hypothetical protein
MKQILGEEQTTNKHMKKYSTSLDINEMQIQTTLRFLLTPVRRAIINKGQQMLTGCGEGVEEEYSCTVYGKVN